MSRRPPKSVPTTSGTPPQTERCLKKSLEKKMSDTRTKGKCSRRVLGLYPERWERLSAYKTRAYMLCHQCHHYKNIFYIERSLRRLSISTTYYRGIYIFRRWDAPAGLGVIGMKKKPRSVSWICLSSELPQACPNANRLSQQFLPTKKTRADGTTPILSADWEHRSREKEYERRD